MRRLYRLTPLIIAVLVAVPTTAMAAVSVSRPSISISRPSVTANKPSAIRSISPIPANGSKNPLIKPVTKQPSNPVSNNLSANRRPTSKSNLLRRKSIEYKYYRFEDCATYKTISFNGWRCIDRD
ncbi:TPA: hypothetical protein NM870_003623 [Acinetobacter baumannii]|nr:hypothetical protein [Acinetobacter baumannii]